MTLIEQKSQPQKVFTILIVDDEPENIALLFNLLSDKGFEVRAARKASQAISSLEKEAVDLILLDIRMPEVSGFELCEQLRGNKRTASIPIIFLSGLTDVDDKVKGLELGAVDYVTKPFDPDEVLARVMRQLVLKSEYKGDKGHGAYRKSGLEQEKRQEICQRLIAFFDEEKPYLADDLNVELIANKIKVTRNYLSEAVNLELKQNISFFINKYRIDYFCALLQQQHDAPIFELALQSGFNSKSVFNKWFKVITKTTPKKFAKSKLQVP